jgi:acetylornithine deacetylase/succinyl-diaminopimelate desuccinylase-like protein
MKDMVAMTLAVVRDIARSGTRPPRDLVVAFVADEEAGGAKGARFLVDSHAELFEGVTEAIGEVGGFSHTVHDTLRLYPIETAEKGMRWLRLSVTGTSGHGSMLNDDNAVTELAEAVARIGRHRFPVQLTPTVAAFLAEVARLSEGAVTVDDPEACVARLGGLARMMGAVLRHTVNPTQLDAGYKVNVIPGEASAHVDARFLPGFEDEFDAELARILGPRVRREVVHGDIAVETSFDGDLVDAMCAAIRAEDPHGVPVPYMLSGGTDAKSFSRLGIRCFGFSPLRLPADLDFAALFHGVDERVSTDALEFGVRTLARFLAAC